MFLNPVYFRLVSSYSVKIPATFFPSEGHSTPFLDLEMRGAGWWQETDVTRVVSKTILFTTRRN